MFPSSRCFFNSSFGGHDRGKLAITDTTINIVLNCICLKCTSNDTEMSIYKDRETKMMIINSGVDVDGFKTDWNVVCNSNEWSGYGGACWTFVENHANNQSECKRNSYDYLTWTVVIVERIWVVFPFPWTMYQNSMVKINDPDGFLLQLCHAYHGYKHARVLTGKTPAHKHTNIFICLFINSGCNFHGESENVRASVEPCDGWRLDGQGSGSQRVEDVHVVSNDSCCWHIFITMSSDIRGLII